MASPTQWTWVWASSGSWWWIGKPGILQSTGLQRVGHDRGTELTDSLWILMNCFVFQIHWFSVPVGHLNFICEGVARNVNTIWHLSSLLRNMVDFPIGLHLQLHKFKDKIMTHFQMMTKEYWVKLGDSAAAQVTHPWTWAWCSVFMYLLYLQCS